MHNILSLKGLLKQCNKYLNENRAALRNTTITYWSCISWYVNKMNGLPPHPPKMRWVCQSPERVQGGRE